MPFEGQDGGKYSAKSIQQIFRKAVDKSGAKPWGTLHTLRHNFEPADARALFAGRHEIAANTKYVGP